MSNIKATPTTNAADTADLKPIQAFIPPDPVTSDTHWGYDFIIGLHEVPPEDGEAASDSLYRKVQGARKERTDQEYTVFIPIDRQDSSAAVTDLIQDANPINVAFSELPLLASFFVSAVGERTDEDSISGVWLKVGNTAALMLNDNDEANCYTIAGGVIKKRMPKGLMVVPLGTKIEVVGVEIEPRRPTKKARAEGGGW